MSMQDEGELQIINSRGLPTHSSTPDKGKNAITQLLVFLCQFELGQNDVADFIKFLAKYIGSENNGRLLNIDFNDDISGNLTVNLGSISIDEEKASAVVNIRYPVKTRYEDILNNILQVSSDKKIDVSVLRHKAPLYIESESGLIAALIDAYKYVTAEETYTVAIGGQTYAKAFKNMAAFGPVFPGEEERAHMPDEYINIESLVKCAKIYGRAIYELAR
jgi:succinyl-diaminopimelate desuccinylase